MSARSGGLVYAAIGLAVVAIVMSAVSLTAAPTTEEETKTVHLSIKMGEQAVITEAEEGDVEAGEFHRWEPGILVVQKGEYVILHVTNPRSTIHSFALPDFGVETGDLAPRGGTATVEFTADEAGVFKFQCATVPTELGRCNIDHEFMVGYLIVQE